MLRAHGEAAGGDGFSQGSDAHEKFRGVRASERNWVRVDEAEGAVRAFLQGDEHAGEVCYGGDVILGDEEDEEDDGGEEQEADALGAHLGDEHRGS